MGIGGILKTAIKLPLKFVRDAVYRVALNSKDPNYFGRKGTERFDSGTGAFGVLYGSQSQIGAMIESVGKREKFRAIREKDFEKRSLCTLQASRPLRLIDLTGPGLKRLGLDGNISTDHDYKDAQRIADFLFNHSSRPDGIFYRACNDLSQCSMALFERPDYSLTLTKKICLIDHPLLAQFLKRYLFRLV
jgi:hypothetical protein